MSEFEKRSIEQELKRFASRNFVRPSNCRNLEQIRFYIRELCIMIEEYKERFNYVPTTAYSLLSEYNSKQNSMLYREFLSNY
jgi:hypothetical protein